MINIVHIIKSLASHNLPCVLIVHVPRVFAIFWSL